MPAYAPQPKRADWESPQWLFDTLDRVFSFELDVCATPNNAKCPRFITPEENGLITPWEGRCWMNPPYGREISDWVAKASREAGLGRALVVGLIPARTDTRWWHEFVSKSAQVNFIKGRLRYGQAQHTAPFPSVLAYWLPNINRGRQGG